MIRALLIGREPGTELGYHYVAEPPYDVVVIGAGNGGLTAAIRVLQGGLLLPAAGKTQPARRLCHQLQAGPL